MSLHFYVLAEEPSKSTQAIDQPQSETKAEEKEKEEHKENNSQSNGATTQRRPTTADLLEKLKPQVHYVQVNLQN